MPKSKEEISQAVAYYLSGGQEDHHFHPRVEPPDNVVRINGRAYERGRNTAAERSSPGEEELDRAIIIAIHRRRCHDNAHHKGCPRCHPDEHGHSRGCKLCLEEQVGPSRRRAIRRRLAYLLAHELTGMW